MYNKEVRILYGLFDKRKGYKMKKVLTSIVSVVLIASMGLSVAGCAKKIKPVTKKDFKKALEETFDIDDDDYGDYDGDDYVHISYGDHDYDVEFYQFDDDDDAFDMFDDLYDAYEDMIEDKDFTGKHRAVYNEKAAYGYILLNGEADDKHFFDDDIYGGIYWSGDTIIIVLVTSDKDKYVDNVSTMIRAIGYPKP